MKLTRAQILSFLLILALPLGRRHILWDASPMVAGDFSPFARVAVMVADILFIVLGIAIFLNKSKLDSLKITKNVWFLMYFLWSLILTLVLPRETWFTTFVTLKTAELLGFLLVFSLVSRDELVFKTIAWGFTLMGMFQGFLAIIQFSLQHSLGLHFLGETALNINIQGLAKIQSGSQLLLRPYGTLDHPNQLAAFILVACATSLYLLITEQRRLAKVIAACCIVVLTFVEFLTLSRAGIGALLIVYFVFLFLSYQTHKLDHELKRLFIVLLISIVIPLTSLFPLLSSRATLVDNATLSRVQYDKIGLEIYKEHPLLGVGPGNIIFAVAGKMPYVPSWEVQPPHNFFIDVACETGILGLAFFMTALICLYVRLFKNRGEGNIKNFLAIALLTGFVFLMMFDHYFYDLPQTQLLFWSVIGIITGIVSQQTSKI